MLCQVDFTPHPKAISGSRERNMMRFQVNPERNWGPSTRSSTKVLGQSQQEKKIRNQSRRQAKKKEDSAEAQSSPAGLVDEGSQSAETENISKRQKVD